MGMILDPNYVLRLDDAPCTLLFTHMNHEILSGSWRDPDFMAYEIISMYIETGQYK